MSRDSLKILSAKPLATLHFHLHKYWVTPTFKTRRYAFHVSLTGLLWCFSVVECQKKYTMKATQEICDKLPHLLLGLEKKPTFALKLNGIF